MGREADESELPAVLARPPWLERRPVAPLPTMEGLAPLPFEERISMSDAQRAHFGPPSFSLNDLRGWNKVPVHLAPRTPEMDAFVRGTLEKPTRYGASWLHLVSDEAAWAYLDAVGIGKLLADTYDVRHLYVRFGAPLLDVLERHGCDLDLSQVFELESPRLAVAMAEAMARGPKAARDSASRYFATFPEASAIGIIPRALAKKTQKPMLRALQAVAADGRAGVVRAVAARHGAEVDAAVAALLAYEGPPKKPPALPGWYAPEALPPVALRTDDRRLPPGAVLHLGTLLAMRVADGPDELLEEVKRACSRESLARFAWALFEIWLAEGAPSKEDWALAALGDLGDDAVARDLAPLVRAWPGEAAHARAVKGLDALARIGTDVALMHLDGIAQKVKFKALQERAREKIAEVAAQRGLSREQLADRIAPSLGLDPDGSRSLSFGTRSFRVGFDEQLAPFVTDDQGKRLGDLPKPRASDDSDAANAAVAEWKALKKDARAVAANQIHRLERAMCSQRRWAGDEFRSLLVEHPLVFHLTRRLVWGAYHEGRLARLFRVAEDRTFADEDDARVELGAGASVGVAHRLEIPDAAATRWGAVLADYQILQPFPQLSREVYEVATHERGAKALTRMQGVEVPTTRLLGLESRGWRRGATGDGGVVDEMIDPLADGLWAELGFEEGFYVASLADSPKTQTLGAVVIRRAETRSMAALPLGELPRLLFSELVRDLESLRPRG